MNNLLIVPFSLVLEAYQLLNEMLNQIDPISGEKSNISNVSEGSSGTPGLTPTLYGKRKWANQSGDWPVSKKLILENPSCDLEIESVTSIAPDDIVTINVSPRPEVTTVAYFPGPVTFDPISHDPVEASDPEVKPTFPAQFDHTGNDDFSEICDPDSFGQDVKIERIESVMEIDQSFYESHPAGRSDTTIFDMEKIYHNMRKAESFSFLLDFVSLNDFLQNRKSDDHVDIFLEK